MGDLADARYDLEGKLSDAEKRLAFLVDKSTWTEMLKTHLRTKETYEKLHAQRFESAQKILLWLKKHGLILEKDF